MGERLWKWCQKTPCRVKQTLGSPSCDINAFSMIGSRSDYTWPHQKPGVNAPKMHWDQITTKPFWSLKTNVDHFPHLSAMSDVAFIICSPGSNEHYAIILLSNYFSALQLNISLFSQIQALLNPNYILYWGNIHKEGMQTILFIFIFIFNYVIYQCFKIPLMSEMLLLTIT